MTWRRMENFDRVVFEPTAVALTDAPENMRREQHRGRGCEASRALVDQAEHDGHGSGTQQQAQNWSDHCEAESA